MQAYLLDIETIPRPEKELLALMPPELLNPQMPEEIANPPAPDLTKCPVYSGDLEKQRAWKDKTVRETHEKASNIKQNWLLKTAEDKQKWLGDAALHAPRGSVKIIGIRHVAEKRARCLLIDASPEERKKIESIDAWSSRVEFVYASEVEALTAFYEFVHAHIGRSSARTDFSKESALPAPAGVLIGYYISQFDFRFLIRRAMIIGAKVCKKLVKGRYFDDSLYIDLDEAYKLGEKELKIGGLKGLSQILGVKVKEGDGENFGNIWRNNPVAAIEYHLAEMLVIEECSRKMGII